MDSRHASSIHMHISLICHKTSLELGECCSRVTVLGVCELLLHLLFLELYLWQSSCCWDLLLDDGSFCRGA